MRPSKHNTNMVVAAVIATRSTCIRRSVGAVLVDHRDRILSTGRNGPAYGQPHCTESPCPGAKFDPGTGLGVCEAIHAEQNALMQCKDVDRIYALYCTTAPCKHCTKMLLNTGCEVIYYLEGYEQSGERLWKEADKKWVKLEHQQLADTIEAGGLSAFVGGLPREHRPRDEGSRAHGKGAR